MVRGRGYITSTEDLDKIAVGTNVNGTPILLRDVASVQLGSDMRRGVLRFRVSSYSHSPSPKL